MQVASPYNVNYLTPQKLRKLWTYLDECDELQQAEFWYDWENWGRHEQFMPEGDWYAWINLSGRGFGKTRTGAQWVLHEEELATARGERLHIALVGQTPLEVRKVMIEGESGIINCAPPWNRPTYNPSTKTLRWPSGTTASAYSGYDPEKIRGPQHHLAWVDEVCFFKYPVETWDNLMFGLRLGESKVCITTTPKPGNPILTDLLDRCLAQFHSRGREDLKTSHLGRAAHELTDGIRVVRGSTYANIRNLSRTYREEVVKPYEGTRKGRQELEAEILEDVEGALWSRELLEEGRVSKFPPLQRVVVGVDPPGSSISGEAGIVVAGLGRDNHVYILADNSLRGTPGQWGRESIAAYHVHQADRIVGEANFGGEMVEHTIRTAARDDDTGEVERVSYKSVRASRGKEIRAEPVAALSEKGQLHIVGMESRLEDELCTWVPNSGEKSPNRLDAMVWAVAELIGRTPRSRRARVQGGERPSRWRPDR